MARTTDRREFLQLAHVYNPAKHSVLGWFASEKHDGMRAFWDGGITRGLYAEEVPFANVAKDGRLVSKPKATGLWSRYGKPIQAPTWFLDELPPYPLDGELTMGRGTFQALMSAARRLEPDDDTWAKVIYHPFDLPCYSSVFRDGTINVPNFEKKFLGVLDWLRGQKRLKWEGSNQRRFEAVVFLLEKHHPYNANAIVRSMKQEQLPFSGPLARARIEELLNSIVDEGGEGLILRNHNTPWEPQRTHNLLKVKPFQDEEVTVQGYIWGRETDRGSKLLGLMGAMIVDFRGKRLELSGFTGEERKMARRQYDPNVPEANEAGRANPGKEVDSSLYFNPKFPIGTKVTIRYRDLTIDGLPKEARFWRKFTGL